MEAEAEFYWNYVQKYFELYQQDNMNESALPNGIMKRLENMNKSVNSSNVFDKASVGGKHGQMDDEERRNVGGHPDDRYSFSAKEGGDVNDQIPIRKSIKIESPTSFKYARKPKIEFEKVDVDLGDNKETSKVINKLQR